jgi:hypothetical protein
MGPVAFRRLAATLTYVDWVKVAPPKSWTGGRGGCKGCYRLSLACALLALLGAGSPGFAMDPAHADILGLRLGQSQTEVVDRLTRQGAALMPASDGLAAKTRDGELEILLDGPRGVTQIRYAFNGRGVGEPSAIRTSILIRFGPPDQEHPMAWCKALDATAHCPADRPALIYAPDSLVLILRSHE